MYVDVYMIRTDGLTDTRSITGTVAASRNLHEYEYEYEYEYE